MTIAAELAPVTTDTYISVVQFYARQMQLIDDGLIEEWAETFTTDGVFATNVKPEPTTGRDAIGVAAGQIASGLEQAGVRRRHIVGVLDVRSAPDGELFARSYVQVLEIPRDGKPALRASTACEDHLVADPTNGWLVRERRVSRDDIR